MIDRLQPLVPQRAQQSDKTREQSEIFDLNIGPGLDRTFDRFEGALIAQDAGNKNQDVDRSGSEQEKQKLKKLIEQYYSEFERGKVVSLILKHPDSVYVLIDIAEKEVNNFLASDDDPIKSSPKAISVLHRIFGYMKEDDVDMSGFKDALPKLKEIDKKLFPLVHKARRIGPVDEKERTKMSVANLDAYYLSMIISQTDDLFSNLREKDFNKNVLERIKNLGKTDQNLNIAYQILEQGGYKFVLVNAFQGGDLGKIQPGLQATLWGTEGVLNIGKVIYVDLNMIRQLSVMQDVSPDKKLNDELKKLFKFAN